MKKEALLLFLIKTILVTTASLVTKFERNWNITLNSISSDDLPLGKDNIATYAKCNDISNTERECILTYEFLHPEGFIFKNECYLNFRNYKGIDRINKMKIRAVRKGKVIISYLDNEIERKESEWATAYTTYRFIDTTTCKFKESKVLFNTSQVNEDLGDRFWQGNVFLYDDGTFDTFLAQKDLCDGARCKVNFGVDGEMIEEPVSYLSDEMIAKDIRMFPVSDKGSHNDFFVLVPELKKTPSSKQDRLSAFKLMHKSATSSIADTVLDLHDVVNFDVDNAHGALGICWSKINNKNHAIIECRQFNIINIVVFSATFELPYLVKTLKVKNSWGSEELILLTDKCKDDSCKTDDGYLYIRAINRRKSHSGIMEFSALNCPGEKKELSISVFNKNSKDDKICVSESCREFVRGEHRKSYNHIKLVRECFGTKYIQESF